jgi:integrase
MATYRKTDYGWRAEVYCRGVRDSQSAFETKGAAREWAQNRESEIMGGLRGETPKGMLVRDLIARFREEVAPAKRGAEKDIIRLRAMERDRLANINLRHVDSPHVIDWQRRRLKSVAPSTVRREQNLLRTVFQAGVRWRLIKVNPCVIVPRPAEPPSRKRTASDAEFEALLAIASPAMRRAIILARETGMRRGEIPRATLPDRIAFLADSKNGESRHIPFTPEALDAWGDGKSLAPATISRQFAVLCRQAGIVGLRFHDLRRTASTRLSKKLNAYQLSKMVGHKDLNRVLKTYYAEEPETVLEILHRKE